MSTPGNKHLELHVHVQAHVYYAATCKVAPKRPPLLTQGAPKSGIVSCASTSWSSPLRGTGVSLSGVAAVCARVRAVWLVGRGLLGLFVSMSAAGTVVAIVVTVSVSVSHCCLLQSNLCRAPCGGCASTVVCRITPCVHTSASAWCRYGMQHGVPAWKWWAYMSNTNTHKNHFLYMQHHHKYTAYTHSMYTQHAQQHYSTSMVAPRIAHAAQSVPTEQQHQGGSPNQDCACDKTHYQSSCCFFAA